MTTQPQLRALTLPHHFAELRKSIEPPEDRKRTAATIPEQVRDFLEDSPEFATQIPHSRLAGSYARHTSIHSIKDIDFVVFLDVPDEENPDPGEVIDDLFATLKSLPDALDRPGSAQALRRQRRSVHVYFEDEDFHLDVVPAWPREGLDEPLWVPDREWNKWIKSDPLGYGRALSTLNADAGEKAVPLVKLFKHWRTIQMQQLRPKSYWLEALVYRHLENGWVTSDGKSYSELFTDFIRSVRDDFQPALDGEWVPVIPDPMLGHDVAFTWERTAFESLMGRLEDSIGWAEAALAKDREEIDDAIELWQKVFGDEYFTDSVEARRLQRAEWLAAGPVYVASDGRVSGDRPVVQNVVEPRPHKFYGDTK